MTKKFLPILMIAGAAGIFCGFGSCTTSIQVACQKQLPELHASLDNASAALRAWDNRNQVDLPDRALASLDGVLSERDAQVAQVRAALASLKDDQIARALQEFSPEQIDQAIHALPPDRVPAALRGVPSDVLVQAAQDAANHLVKTDVSYMAPVDRETWRNWAITQLKDAQEYMDILEDEPELRAAHRELNRVANMLVEFAGYAEMGNSPKMIAVMDRIRDGSEKVHELACGEKRTPAAVAASPSPVR